MAAITPSINSITITTTDYVIRGYVYNRNLSTPFPFAFLYCYSETTRQLVATSATDSTGFYQLFVPAGDTYFIVADAMGQQAGVIDNLSPSIP